MRETQLQTTGLTLLPTFGALVGAAFLNTQMNPVKTLLPATATVMAFARDTFCLLGLAPIHRQPIETTLLGSCDLPTYYAHVAAGLREPDVCPEDSWLHTDLPLAGTTDTQQPHSGQPQSRR